MNPRNVQAASDDDLITLAREAITYTKAKLPLGSVNKKSDMLKPDYFRAARQLEKMREEKKDLVNRLMFTFTMNRDPHQDQRLLKLKWKALVYEKYKVGNCEEQATVALSYLKRRGFDDVDYCVMDGGDHHFLLLNGRIICDPWADKVYHVKDFAIMREIAKQFHYADAVYTERADVRSYMFGIPRVKFSTGKETSPSIIDGQFVRSGVEDLRIDYSEFIQALQADHDRIYGKNVKTVSLEDFFMANSRTRTQGVKCHDGAPERRETRNIKH